MSGGGQGVADYLRDFSKIFFDARLTPSPPEDLKREIHVSPDAGWMLDWEGITTSSDTQKAASFSYFFLFMLYYLLLSICA